MLRGGLRRPNKARRIPFWTMLGPGPKSRGDLHRLYIFLIRQNHAQPSEKNICPRLASLVGATSRQDSPKTPQDPAKDPPRRLPTGIYVHVSGPPKSGQERTQADFDTIVVEFRIAINKHIFYSPETHGNATISHFLGHGLAVCAKRINHHNRNKIS